MCGGVRFDSDEAEYEEEVERELVSPPRELVSPPSSPDPSRRAGARGETPIGVDGLAAPSAPSLVLSAAAASDAAMTVRHSLRSCARRRR